ncbi:MAG: carbonic anhydrase [Methanomicrobiales archaeon]|nr:carbonic anhydrase [Methanomicrobiales archaeon]
MLERLLEGNRSFRTWEFDQNRSHYDTIAKGQNPEVLFICCADSRIEPGRITRTRAGGLFVVRNVGNIIPPGDTGIAAVLEFAIPQLKIPTIVLCGHSGCASIRALDWEPNDEPVFSWLRHAHPAKERVDARIPLPRTEDERKERYRLIELENVRLQIEHLYTYPLLKKAVDEKRVAVHGLYYDLATGALTRVT